MGSSPKKRIAFGWYGGKFSHLEWLLPLLPTTHHYCEPFGGSACDPPYVHQTRGDVRAYAYEMTDDAHRQLAELLHSVKGKVAISGYRCKLMDELYHNWYCTEAPPRICHSVKQLRQEVLWTNYDPQEVITQNRKSREQSSNGATKVLSLDLNLFFMRGVCSFLKITKI